MVDDDDITEADERTSLIGMNTTAINVEVDYVEFIRVLLIVSSRLSLKEIWIISPIYVFIR